MHFDCPEIIDLLKFHIEAGCADVLNNAPVNHFADAELASPEPIAPKTGEPAAYSGLLEGASP